MSDTKLMKIECLRGLYDINCDDISSSKYLQSSNTLIRENKVIEHIFLPLTDA